jgi:quercetin dioxygenase-like cupin family protein
MDQKTDPLDPSLRRVVSTTDTGLRPYDRYGRVNPHLSWLPLSRIESRGYECFLLRFEPGGASTPHEHTGGEEFFVLDGEITDSDGTVFRPGDFVSYRPGSRHWSVSAEGCTLLAILLGRNEALTDPGSPAA